MSFPTSYADWQTVVRVWSQTLSNMEVYIERNREFSNTETRTGETWLTGQTIYRKVIEIGNLPNNTIKNVAHGIPAFLQMVKVYGVATDGETNIPLPFTTSTTSSVISLAVTADNVRITTATNYTVYTGQVILEYIKQETSDGS